MEVMQTTAKMQSSQTSEGAKTGSASAGQAAAQAQAIQKAAQDAQVQRAEIEQSSTQKIETQEQMQQLVKKLNAALDPFRTSLRFGFDNSSEDFYVSVIETKSNRMIRRFPAEKAFEVLPKMQELNGILFDEKG